MTALLDITPAPGAATRTRATASQAAHEMLVSLRNGEQLLLTIVIPTVLLILFASAPVISLPKPRVDFLVPGILALAVMSTAFTGQAIAVGFERKYGVLRRLATTPLRRSSLLTAKTIAVIATELLQIALLAAVGTALGWKPHNGALPAAGLLLLGTIAFSSLGLLMAGTLRAEATLAAANLVYILLLVLGGVAFPLTDFPTGLRDGLQLLPVSAMSGGLRDALLRGVAPPLHDWLTLIVWAVAGTVAAATWFRWD